MGNLFNEQQVKVKRYLTTSETMRDYITLNMVYTSC